MRRLAVRLISAAAGCAAMASAVQAAPIIGLFNSGTGTGNVALLETHAHRGSHGMAGDAHAQPIPDTAADDSDFRLIAAEHFGGSSEHTHSRHLSASAASLPSASVQTSHGADSDDAEVIIPHVTPAGSGAGGALDVVSTVLTGGSATGSSYVDTVIADIANAPASLNTSSVNDTGNASDSSTASADAAPAARISFIGTIPEPATWAMMMIGFALAGHSLRRATSQRGLRVRLA